MFKKELYLFIFLLVFTASCKEPYHPEIDTNVSGIVINGLITDEPGPYTINITRPMSYDSIKSVPVQNANVFVTDNKHNVFFFYETTPGIYISDTLTFKPAYYSQYTLNVITMDGHSYRSTPQLLYPKGNIDSVHSVVGIKTMTTYQNGLGERIKDIKGTEFVSNNFDNSEAPYFRYSNMLVVEYEVQLDNIDGSLNYLQHCWIKYIPYPYLNLNDKKSNQQLLGFCPLESNFYGIFNEQLFSIPQGGGGKQTAIGTIYRQIQLFVITFKQYHLNEDVYDYYREVNTQMAASEKFLDPINIQCYGNLVSISNPDEHVMGVFEVSSVTIKSYSYHKDLNGHVDLQALASFDANSVRNDDCIYDKYPDFWIY
jgi:hypothetical protein